MANLFSIPAVASKIPQGLGPVLKSVPVSQRLNCYVHPWHLDLSAKAKYGEAGVYPSMVQVRSHLPSVIWRNYHSEQEALDIKFDIPAGDDLGFFNVRYIDGHCKGLIVQSILALIVYMDPRRFLNTPF